MTRWGKESGTEYVELANRAPITHEAITYGESVSGTPLLAYLPRRWSSKRTLVMAGIHGEEGESTHVLSAALRTVMPDALRCTVIIGLNPDGLSRGTRGNAHNVDLNRNFPASNWSSDPVATRWETSGPRETRLETGTAPASEPEVSALLQFIADNQIEQVVSIHAPLACVDSDHTPEEWPLVGVLAQRLALEHVRDIGYATPGSMGTWAREQKRPLVTLEMEEDLSVMELRHKYGPVLIDLLLGRLPGL